MTLLRLRHSQRCVCLQIQVRNLQKLDSTGFRPLKEPPHSIFDSDDLLHPQHLEVLTKAARAKPGRPAYVTNAVEFRESQPAFRLSEKSAYILDDRQPLDAFPAPATVSPGTVRIDPSTLAAVGRMV